MRNFCSILLAAAFVGPVASQEKSWANKTVFVTKPGIKIARTNEKGKQDYIAELKGIDYKVLADQNGWIKVNDGRGSVGWFEKADAVPLEEAVAFFTVRIQNNPKDVGSFNFRAWAYVLTKDLDAAIQDYGEALKLQQAAYLYNNRANAWMNKGDYDHAIDDFSKAIELDRKYALYYANRGVAWSNKKDHDKAIADFSEAIQRDAKYVNAYLHRGRSWHAKADYDKAISDFGKATEIDPYYAIAYTDRGVSWHAKKDYDKAIADYSEALLLSPKDVYTFYRRGMANQEKKDYVKAVADFSDAVRIDPNHSWSHFEKARVLALQGNVDSALESLARAIELNSAFYAPAQTDGAFSSIRNDPRYKQLMEKYKK